MEKYSDLITDDQTGVIYRKWQASSPEAIFLLVHGLGAHGGRWRFLSDFFLQRNISSYAIELKGFGQTSDLKGHIDSFNTYLDDIIGLCLIAKRENKGKKVFIIGESLGALISLLEVISKPDLFSGLICISPAFKSILKFSPLDYIKIIFSLFLNPKKQFKVPFNASMCTRDTDYQKVMDNDFWEHRLATPRLLFNTLSAQKRANALRNKITIPVLFLLAGEDKLVDSKASQKFFSRLTVEDKAIIEYSGMYHALSIDLGREKVFEDIYKWVQKRI